jgi:ATP-dependent Clp protease ATP-binding subunit ClpA
MYERFTDRARKVMQLANQEAQRRNHEYIGTEHILLGLIQEGAGVAANVLKNLDIDFRKICLEVEKIVQSGPEDARKGKLPQTPRAKQVVEYAIEESRSLSHNYVGTEHLLLGLLREQEGVAAQVLMNLGIRLETIREEVLALLGQNQDVGEAGERTTGSGRRTKQDTEQTNLPEHILQILRELEAQLKQLEGAKEDAIAQQDFEQAAYLRDQADKVVRQKEGLARAWQGKAAQAVREFDLYVPVRYDDGSPVEPDKLARIRTRLVEQFGGLIELRHPIEGLWKIGNTTLRDELIIYRVLTSEAARALLFFTQLKEELKTDLRQDEVLIVTRNVEVL